MRVLSTQCVACFSSLPIAFIVPDNVAFFLYKIQVKDEKFTHLTCSSHSFNFMAFYFLQDVSMSIFRWKISMHVLISVTQREYKTSYMNMTIINGRATGHLNLGLHFSYSLSLLSAPGHYSFPSLISLSAIYIYAHFEYLILISQLLRFTYCKLCFNDSSSDQLLILPMGLAEL